MSVTHYSLASLQEAVDSLIRNGDLETPLGLIQTFVERVISDRLLTGRVFAAPALDELCLRIGAEVLFQINLATPAPTEGRVAYVATEFYRHGGHTLVAADFVRLLPNRDHLFLMTDILSNPHQDAPDLRLKAMGAKVEVAPAGSRLERLRWLLLRLFELAPEKTLWFNHHEDAVAVAAAQPAVPGEKYFIHHADHNLCLGVHAPELRHVDLHNLGFFNCRDVLGIADNLYWPLVCDDLGQRGEGLRFIESGTLRTCSSGSGNKFEVSYLYDYADLIPRVLRATKGEHLHIGNLSEKYLERIRRGLADEGIPQERFVHVPWVPSLWQVLIDRRIDVYLASWPIGGGKALIEAMGAGIPPVVHVNYVSRFHSGFDLAYAEALTWRTLAELIDRLTGLTSESLASQSRLARAHYEKHHAPRVLASLLKGDATDAPEPIPLRDYRPDALQTFLDERALQDAQFRDVAEARHRADAALNETRSALARTNAELDAERRMRAQTDAALNEARSALAQTNAMHAFNVETLQAENAGLRRTIDALRTSTSWRITAPLRALRGTLVWAMNVWRR